MFKAIINLFKPAITWDQFTATHPNKRILRLPAYMEACNIRYRFCIESLFKLKNHKQRQQFADAMNEMNVTDLKGQPVTIEYLHDVLMGKQSPTLTLTKACMKYHNTDQLNLACRWNPFD